MNSKVFFIFLTLFFYNSQLFCAEFPEIKGLDEEEAAARGDVKKSSEPPKILEEKESGIWVQLGDYKTVIQIPYEVARLSNFLRAGLLDLPEKERAEISQSNPFPLPSINEKEFKLFLNIAKFLILDEIKPEIKIIAFNLLLKNLRNINLEIEDIGRLYYLSFFLDIPMLTKFILENIAQLFIIDKNCLDKLLKNLDGSPFNVINEKSFKNNLLQNTWLQKALSEPFILKKEIKTDKPLEQNENQFSYYPLEGRWPSAINLNDNTRFVGNLHGEILIQKSSGKLPFLKKTWETVKIINTLDRTPIGSMSLSGDKKWLAIFQRESKAVRIYRILINNDEIFLEHLNIDYIPIEHSLLFKVVINFDGTKLLLLPIDDIGYALPIIFNKIDNIWRFNSELRLQEEENENIKRIIEFQSKDENIISIKTLNILDPTPKYFEYIIYLVNPEQNKKLSINQLILLLILNELNKTETGKEIISKNREKIFEALKQYPVNIQHRLISTEYGFSENEINKLEKGVL